MSEREEARRFFRVPVMIGGSLQVRGEIMPWDVTIVDLTPLGAKIRMAIPIKAKGLLFDLTFKASGHMVSVRGKIVNAIGKDTFGIEFTDISDFAYTQICAYLYYRMQVLGFRPPESLLRSPVGTSGRSPRPRGGFAAFLLSCFFWFRSSPRSLWARSSETSSIPQAFSKAGFLGTRAITETTAEKERDRERGERDAMTIRRPPRVQAPAPRPPGTPTRPRRLRPSSRHVAAASS